VSGTAAAFIIDIIFDPQTSGGLLIAIDAADAGRFEEAAQEKGAAFWVIGEFVSEPRGKILV
jgi:selenide,water dikinase